MNLLAQPSPVRDAPSSRFESEVHTANECAEAMTFLALVRPLLAFVATTPSRMAWLPGEDKEDALDTLERWASLSGADVEHVAEDEAAGFVNEGVM